MAVSALLLIAMLISLISCAPSVNSEDRAEVSSVSLNITEYFFTDIKDYVQLSAAIKPEKEDNKTVTWQSSDPDVATVDAMGTVRPVSLEYDLSFFWRVDFPCWRCCHEYKPPQL